MPSAAKFFFGFVLINLAGATACWIVATKYPGASASAALWGVGAAIGYLMASIQTLHVFAPTKENSGRLATAGTGVLLLAQTGWLLGVVVSIAAEDSEGLLRDFQLIATSVWRGITGILS